MNAASRPRGGQGQALAEEVLDAHGGADRWAALDAIEANLSATGSAMTLKGQPAALWTLFQLPFHLLDPGATVERLGDRGGLRRLRVGFPQRVSTHCPSQTMHSIPTVGSATPDRPSPSVDRADP